MAYNSLAEKRVCGDVQVLHQRLKQFVVCEFFPVEVSNEFVTIGISVPRKSLDDPGSKSELERLLRYLISDEEFMVTDLYTGESVLASNIPELAKQIAG